MDIRKSNKKIVLFVILAVIITLTCIIVITLKNKKQNANEKIDIVEEMEEKSIDEDYKEYEFDVPMLNSNSENSYEVEAQNIHLHVIGKDLEVIATLKNKTEEKINGYYIEIELLDKDGNYITTISENSIDIIEPNESKEIINYVSGLEKQEEISSARIVLFEKNGINSTMEQEVEEMTTNIEE